MLKRLMAAAALSLATLGSALAEDYPNHRLTMIIPFAAGGPTDLVGRLIAQHMGDTLGQPVVVENVGGAGGMIGSSRVAHAAPDGYTFGIGTVGTHAQSQTLHRHPMYNAATDFTPVALIAEVPIVLITRTNLPVNNLKEFIAYTKKNQAKMQYGSGGVGAASHLGCVVLNMAMGTHVTHVPYKGGNPAMQDVLAGRIDFECEIMSTAKSHIDAGTLKALAMMSKTRSKAEPNVPTTVEQGLDAEAYTWNAAFLPKDTPPAIVKKLNSAIVKAMNSPDVRARLEKLGAEIASPDRSTPEYLGTFVKSEIKKWAAPIKASGAIVD